MRTNSRMEYHQFRHIVCLVFLVCSSVQGFLGRMVSRPEKNVYSYIEASPSSSQDALQRTASQLKKLQHNEPDNEYDKVYQAYVRQSANALKQELKERRLPTKGKKTDLATRLTEHDLRITSPGKDAIQEQPEVWEPEASNDEGGFTVVRTFAGLVLSSCASSALTKAQFKTPSPIQQAVIPPHVNGESLILHAETGSGKTLAYLLPITEQVWLEHNDGITTAEDGSGYAFVLTPTRELAAQVAGVATALAPPGTVRLISHATDLATDGLKDRGQEAYGGRLEKGDGRTQPRIIVGSAKAVMHSLYGDGKMPASPTSKPEAMAILRQVRWVVMDEVDRLLDVKKTRSSTNGKHRHEKPAAVVTSAVTRLTFGKAQVIAASATVGRSLRRELSRVLGLSPQESPTVIRANPALKDDEEYSTAEVSTSGHIGRAVTIPTSVEHYVTAVDTSSTGQLLTSAIYVLKGLQKAGTKRILMVLTRGCGVNTQNAVGALKHFQCKPEPFSLLDVLEADGTDRMITIHREVTGSTGVGESYFSSTPDDDKEDESSEGEGYLLVTGEDTVRGLHLDSLDYVVVVGRAQGPDEYTHIAGRTGRAGKRGRVINVLSHQHAKAVGGWETMLEVDFQPVAVEDIETLN